MYLSAAYYLQLSSSSFSEYIAVVILTQFSALAGVRFSVCLPAWNGAVQRGSVWWISNVERMARKMQGQRSLVNLDFGWGGGGGGGSISIRWLKCHSNDFSSSSSSSSPGAFCHIVMIRRLQWLNWIIFNWDYFQLVKCIKPHFAMFGPHS